MPVTSEKEGPDENRHWRHRIGEVTVYQKHRSLQVVRRCIGTDVARCGRLNGGVQAKMKPQNGGRNYNGPKVAKFCQVSSDP